MQQSALRSFAIVCDYMETTPYDRLRSAIRDRLRSYGNQALVRVRKSSLSCFLTVQITNRRVLLSIDKRKFIGILHKQN